MAVVRTLLLAAGRGAGVRGARLGERWAALLLSPVLSCKTTAEQLARIALGGGALQRLRPPARPPARRAGLCCLLALPRPTAAIDATPLSELATHDGYVFFGQALRKAVPPNATAVDASAAEGCACSDAPPRPDNGTSWVPLYVTGAPGAWAWAGWTSEAQNHRENGTAGKESLSRFAPRRAHASPPLPCSELLLPKVL